jgi:thioredoxin-like negative regulator of GroEL
MIYEYRSDRQGEYGPFFRKGILFLCFSAPWCGTCRAVRRTVKEFDETHRVTFLVVDVETDKDVAARYGIKGVPAILLFKDGVLLDRMAGSLDHEEFMAWIARNENLKELS